MIVRELIEKLQALPLDARVDICYGIKVNSTSGELARNLDHVKYDDKNGIVKLETNASVQLFY